MITVVLVGPHGAGKTTLGEALASYLGWAFHDEIGRRLAEDPRMRPLGIGPQSPQADFDEEVFRTERDRDLAWPLHLPRVVETWHPGNLAYAGLRSPSVRAAWQPRLRNAIDWSSVRVVPVRASIETLVSRRSEPGDLDFFVRVGELAIREARALGARVLPAVVTDEHSPDVSMRQVSRSLASGHREAR